MKPIKIMHIIEELGVGGAERVVANYMKYHDRAFFLPQVCCLKGGGPVADELLGSNYKVTLLHKRAGVALHVIASLRKLILQEEIGLIHLHNPPANHWGVLSTIGIPGIKRVRTEHNVFYEGRVMKGYPLVNSLLGLFNHKILCCSNGVKQSHIKKDPFLKKKYTRVYNGIDETPFFASYPLEKLKKEFLLKKKQPLVGIIASLTRQKAHHIFLDSVGLVSEEFPDARFLVVGDGILRSQLENFAEQSGLKEKIIFTGIRADIPAILQLLDIFVLSSDWEGFPMTILEAMASGKPCVVTDVGGNSEAVVHGKTGYIVKPGDKDALAGYIKKLLRDVGLKHALGSAAQKHFRDLFSAQSMVRNTEKIYHDLINN